MCHVLCRVRGFVYQQSDWIRSGGILGGTVFLVTALYVSALPRKSFPLIQPCATSWLGHSVCHATLPSAPSVCYASFDCAAHGRCLQVTRRRNTNMGYSNLEDEFEEDLLSPETVVRSSPAAHPVSV